MPEPEPHFTQQPLRVFRFLFGGLTGLIGSRDRFHKHAAADLRVSGLSASDTVFDPASTYPWRSKNAVSVAPSTAATTRSPLVVRLKGLKELRPDSAPHELGGRGREEENLRGADRGDEETTSDFASSNHTASLP